MRVLIYDIEDLDLAFTLLAESIGCITQSPTIQNLILRAYIVPYFEHGATCEPTIVSLRVVSVLLWLSEGDRSCILVLKARNGNILMLGEQGILVEMQRVLARFSTSLGLHINMGRICMIKLSNASATLVLVRSRHVLDQLLILYFAQRLLIILTLHRREIFTVLFFDLK